jgi:hypothetical protein
MKILFSIYTMFSIFWCLFQCHVFFFSVCQKINVVPQIKKTNITQLDRINVRVKGELRDVLIIFPSDPIVHQTIDIAVVDIPKSYGFLLRKYWSSKLQGYLSTNWSHPWIPHKGKANQVRVNSEAHNDRIGG